MGGSGGGSTAGMVSYPDYIMNVHHDWMTSYTGEWTLNPINKTMAETMNDAIGNSPWLGATSFDPDTRITNIETEITALDTLIDALDPQTDWDSILTKAVTSIEEHWNAYTLGAAADIDSAWIDPSHVSYTNIKGNWLDPAPAASAEITADVDAYEAIVDDHVESDVLPRFQRGMQDINGVMTSAFTIGQAIIEGMADRDVAKYQGDLRTKAYLLKDDIVAKSKLGESNRLADAYIEADKHDAASKRGESDALALAHMQDDRLNADNVKGSNLAFLHSVEQMVRLFLAETGAQMSLSGLYMDGQKVGLIAQKEEADQQLDIDDSDARWDLEVYQYGGNLMASASGGTAVPGSAGKPSKTASVIGGAAAGAAMGMQAYPPGGGYSAGAGAVVGAYLAYSQY